ncbi:hypothetical protein U3516DRAFT_775611 [Neocallimastix sp. 'constans']
MGEVNQRVKKFLYIVFKKKRKIIQDIKLLKKMKTFGIEFENCEDNEVEEEEGGEELEEEDVVDDDEINEIEKQIKQMKEFKEKDPKFNKFL